MGTTGDIGLLYKIYVCVRGINTANLHLRHHILGRNQNISLGDCKSSPDARKLDGKDGYFKEIFGIVLNLSKERHVLSSVNSDYLSPLYRSSPHHAEYYLHEAKRMKHRADAMVSRRPFVL